MQNYTYTTSSYDSLSGANAAGLATMSIGLIITYILSVIAAYVFISICLSKIFKKADIASWIAWVPFYNYWKIFEMGDQKSAYIFLALIPFVGPVIFAVFALMAIYKINLKFGKSTGFFLLALFATPIWYAIIAFDKSTWNGISASAAPVAAAQYQSYAQPVQPTYQPQQTSAAPQQQNPTYYNAPQPQNQAQYQPQQQAPVAPVQQPSNDGQQQPPQAPTQYFN